MLCRVAIRTQVVEQRINSEVWSRARGRYRMSSKGSLLNDIRGLILFLIDPIMTSDECRQLCVIGAET